MWHNMFVEHISVTEKLLRTVIVYALIAVLIRISGKRSLGGLSTLDFVVMFLLSNVVQNAIIGDDLSITGGAIGATTLVVVDQILNRVSLHNKTFDRIFNGKQTQVIKDGEVLAPAVHRLGLRRAQLEQAIRQQNGDDVSEVKSAWLEPSGQVVVSLREPEQGATKADVKRLAEQLARIEAALAPTSPASKS